MVILYTEQTGLPFFDRASGPANRNWYYASALDSMREDLSCLLPCGKFWSKLQKLREKKFSFGFKMSVLRVIFC